MQERASFRFAWISLALIGITILIFGVIAALWRDVSDPSLWRAVGVAYIGMGLFGTVITLVAYRRREPWAWFTLWYYPVFWFVHFVAALPPSRDRIHQLLFIGLSVAALLVSANDFFSGPAAS